MKITVDLPETELTEICEITGITKKGPAIRKLLADTLQAQRRARIAGKFLTGQWSAELKHFADILFQLTDKDLASTSSLFKETEIKSGFARSYLFFAIELKGSDYARGKLSAIARQINRVFPMPVMILLKHGAVLSIAVINRCQNNIRRPSFHFRFSTSGCCSEHPASVGW